MEINKDLQQKINYLNAKAAWCKAVAKDAGDLAYYSEARFLRNAQQLAEVELKTIESTIKSMEG